MSNWKITTLFVVSSILLIGASVGTTYICNAIISKLKWDAAFGGSIFVSISTALPEIIGCLTLFHLKNPNAAVAGMIGSSVFNVFTLFINDLITSVTKPPQATFQPDWPAMWLSIFTLLGCFFFLLSLWLLKLKRFDEKWRHPVILVTTSLCASVYPIYIVVCLVSKINKTS